MSLKSNPPWPSVQTVEAMSNFQIKVTTAGKEILILNLKNLIMSRDVYWRLRNEKYFRQVSIDEAGALCWPGGEDLAPEAMEKYAKN